MASSTATEQAPQSAPEENGQATQTNANANPAPARAAAPAAAPALQPVQPQFHSASLYVGDLNPDVTEALLFDIFNAVGPVSSIRVCRDAVTRRSLGYAYVNFHQLSDAERALDTMNYTLIKDRPCRMMWSQRDPSLRKNGAGNVFVKNLDLSIDNKALYDTFSLFGNILSCKVVTDGSGKSKGYGFVHFETVEAANEAIQKINGMLIAGKEVFVGKFLKRNERPSATEWTNVYVKNIPKDWENSKLEEVFSTCGPIQSAVIMRDSEGKSKGFGFVDYVEHTAAQKAIETLNSYEVDAGKVETATTQEDEDNKETEEADKEKDKENEKDKEEAPAENKKEETDGEKKDEDPQKEAQKEPVEDKKMYLVVCRAQKKTERERELSRKFEQLKVERMNKYQGVNLYVKNLAEEVDDDMLRKEFSPYGSITSARVMRNMEKGKDGENVVGTSKGFGFVCFTTPEEAIRAVTEMNGKILASKPVYVALAQRKEARRAQLEAQHQQRGALGARGLPMQPAMYPGSPMFYQGGMQPGGVPPQARQNFAYMPQQMLARGMMQPQARGMPAGFARGFPMPNQAGFPVQQGAPQGGGRGGRRGGRGDRAGGRGVAGMPHVGPGGVPGQPQNANFKYTANARNQPQPIPQPGQAPAAMAQPPQPSATAPLTAAALANASDADQKNMIGERLYPLIQAIEPTLAGKITGMLLEMDNPELLHLIESPESLTAKVSEALQVLRQHVAQ